MAVQRTVGPREDSVQRQSGHRWSLPFAGDTVQPLILIRCLPVVAVIYALIHFSHGHDAGVPVPGLMSPLLYAALAVLIAGLLFSLSTHSSSDQINGQPGAPKQSIPPHSTAKAHKQSGPDARHFKFHPRSNIKPLSQQSKCAWSDLMSQVSHELRTPLNAVIGFSDVMNAELYGPLENPKYREYLTHIRESSHHLLKSAEDTLAMTSLLAGHSGEQITLSEVSAKDAIMEAWAFVTAGEKQHEVELTCLHSTEVAILARRRPLRQTLINLMSAAIEQAEPGSQIFVRAVTEADTVMLAIEAMSIKAEVDRSATALPLVIAEALCELQGTDFSVSTGEDGTWRASLGLEHAVQPDFFTNSELLFAEPEHALA